MIRRTIQDEDHDKPKETPKSVAEDCLQRFFTAENGSPPPINQLSANCTAVAQMVNLVAQWMVLAGVQETDVQAMIEKHLKDMILKTYDPMKALMLFSKQGEMPDWITTMIEHRTWRSLTYELAEKYPECSMLKFVIKIISETGFESEITSIATAAQQFEVFSRVLHAAIVKFLNHPEDCQDMIEEVAKMVCYGQHTYLYSQVLIWMVSHEPKGGFIMKRLSQEITKYALKQHHDVSSITQTLSGSSCYMNLAESLTSMLSSNKLNPAEVTVMYRYYSSLKPPPVELIRNPQFLDLLIDSLFKLDAPINREHTLKYIYVLGYAVSVSESPAENGQRNFNYTELNATVAAIMKAHDICNMSDGSSGNITDLSTLYKCICYPVVGVGVIRWVESIVLEPSFFRLFTGSCPLHLALLDAVASEHVLLHDQILRLLVRLFESKQDGLETSVHLKLKEILLDRMIHLLACGCVIPVLKYIRQCFTQKDTDISLIRYFVAEVLEMVTHPYSSEFVQHFLPIVENEDINSSMYEAGDYDPLTEFIVHCKVNHKTF
uniref:Negative elongation factor D n=1 Tax=Anopheles farauti TaxID=69004 RepID=A0A182QA94_9DIPT